CATAACWRSSRYGSASTSSSASTRSRSAWKAAPSSPGRRISVAFSRACCCSRGSIRFHGKRVMLQMRHRWTLRRTTELRWWISLWTWLVNLACELGLRRGVISSIIVTVTRQGCRPVSVLDGPRFAASACNETGAELLIEDSWKRRPRPPWRRDRLQGGDNDGTCNSRQQGTSDSERRARDQTLGCDQDSGGKENRRGACHEQRPHRRHP